MMKRRATDKHQRLVETPYGRGCVLRTRTNHQGAMQDIELLEWNTATSSSSSTGQAMLYSVSNLPCVRPSRGDDVMCLYGRGRVVELLSDSRCHVALTSWRLAGRSQVHCYVKQSDLQVVQKKTVYEMDPHERVAYAMEQKQLANTEFVHRRYDMALQLYTAAVNAVRHVQHTPSSPNELRADLVRVMITCCNNAASCSAHLATWDESIQHSRMAMSLLEALYEKRGLKIHSIFNKEGLTDVKLFGEWRVKSWFRLGQAYAEKREYAKALEVLKEAREAIVEYTSDREMKQTDTTSVKQLLGQDKQVKKLYAACLQRKKAEKDKEKQRAVAMFGNKTKENSSANGNKKKLMNGAGNKRPTSSPKAAAVKVPSKPAPVPPSTTFAEARGVESDMKPQQGDPNSLLAPPSAFSISKDFPADAASDDGDDSEAWYHQHKEAVILSAVTAGLVALSYLLLRGSRR